MKDSYIAKYNDIQILGIVNSFRFLPLQVLTKILLEKRLYGSYQAVSRCVNRLREHGLIRTTCYTNNAKIIFLSRLGAKQLATGTGVSEDSINCPERLTGVNFFALEHTVKVANLYLLLLRECQKHDIVLKSFTGDHFTRYEYEFRSNHSGKIIKRYVMPDAEMEIEIEGYTFSFWLEYDRGTEYSKDVAVKYMKYLEYYNTIRQDEDKKLPIIIFITESTQERIKNLIQPVSEYKGEWSWNLSHKSFSNVVFKGVTMADDIHSMPTFVVEEFLQHTFLFIDYAKFENNGLNAEFIDKQAKKFKLLDRLENYIKHLTEQKKSDNI